MWSSVVIIPMLTALPGKSKQKMTIALSPQSRWRSKGQPLLLKLGHWKFIPSAKLSRGLFWRL